MLDNELFWAAIWALVHVIGMGASVVLRQRSLRQVHVAEHWRAHAAPADFQEADDLVIVTRDRHRRNTVLVLFVASYLLLGLLVLIYTFYPFLDDLAFRVASRLILVGGEAMLIGSAWASVVVGDQIARKTTRITPSKEETS